jgi:zinc protease
MVRKMTSFRSRSFVNIALILFCCHLAISAGTGAPQKLRQSSVVETWRRQPPKAEAARPFNLPPVRKARLENGLTLVLVEDHRSPIVTMMIGIPLFIEPSEDIASLTNQIAIAEATAELISEGAGSRSSEQVAREVETLGGKLTTTANDDYAEVSVSVVAENAERMVDLVGDVLLRPAFPEEEVALYKRNRIQNVVVQRQDPSFLAGEQFDRLVYGNHPYAISAPTPSSIEQLDRNKLAQFHRSHFGVEKSVAVVVGDFEPDRFERKLRDVFSQWKEPPKVSIGSRAPAELSKESRRQVFLIDRPGSEQADFRIGTLAVRRSDPAYFPLLVANSILGAGTGSRLFLNIRERKGYAYDVYSSVGGLRFGGSFYGGAETRTEVTTRAINEMLAEFDRLRNVKVGQQELQNAKNYLNGLFSLSLSAQGGIAERMVQEYMLDLPQGYLESYRSKIESVTAAQVQEVARKYLLTDRPVIVVVGDASKLAKDLRTIGQVQVLDIEGKPVKRASL